MSSAPGRFHNCISVSLGLWELLLNIHFSEQVVDKVISCDEQHTVTKEILPISTHKLHQNIVVMSFFFGSRERGKTDRGKK